MEMLRIDPQNKNSDSKKSVRFKTAYLFQLVPLINDDEVDRLPMCTRVGWFDLACHAFSMSTYISDMVLDIWVAVQHYNHHRFLAALLTVIFVAVPSVIINIISLLWWLDDRSIRQENHETDVTDNIILRERLERLSRFKKPKKPKSIEITEADFVPDLKAKRSQTIHWILCTVFQVGPLIWHARALKSAYTCMQIQKLPRRERILFHRMYLKMIEADRDASVLRFFEALLESLPQLLIQGYFLIDDVVKAGSLTEFDWKLRAFSMSVSLLCVSFSFVSHHRALRISMPTKKNLDVLNCNLILIWRFASIFGRFVFLSLLIYFHNTAAIGLFFAHTFISLVHLSFLQHIKSGSTFDCLDKLMLLINVWIHTFAPFNMSTGRTRLRYFIGYALEVTEKIVILIVIKFAVVDSSGIAIFQHSGIFMWSFLVYAFGISIMLAYFCCAHPTVLVFEEQLEMESFRESKEHKISMFGANLLDDGGALC